MSQLTPPPWRPNITYAPPTHVAHTKTETVDRSILGAARRRTLDRHAKVVPAGAAGRQRVEQPDANARSQRNARGDRPREEPPRAAVVVQPGDQPVHRPVQRRVAGQLVVRAQELLRRRARLVRRRERGAEATQAEAIAPSVADDDVRLVWVEMVVVARELEREEHVWFGKVVLNPRPPSD